jgi:hypothetical protein
LRWAFANTFRALAAHERAVVQEELQQTEVREQEITNPPFLDELLCPTKADQRHVGVVAQGLFFRFRKL